jgi:mercuric ion binding protein
MKRRLSLAILVAAAALMTLSSAQAAERSVTLKVPTMSCAACPYIVSKALKRVGGVKSVKASLKARTAIVVYDDAKTNLAALTKATESAGYKSSPAQ